MEHTFIGRGYIPPDERLGHRLDAPESAHLHNIRYPHQQFASGHSPSPPLTGFSDTSRRTELRGVELTTSSGR